MKEVTAKLGMVLIKCLAATNVMIIVLAIVASAMFQSCTNQSHLCDAYGTQHYYQKYHKQ